MPYRARVAVFTGVLRLLAFTLCLFVSAGAQQCASAADSVKLHFAFFGCNRVGFNDLSSDNPSSANREQLLQSFSELLAAPRPPSHLFLVGDIVTNYARGTDVFRSQLKGWRELYSGTPMANSSVVMVPIVGNHEVLKSDQDPVTKVWTDSPNPSTVAVWGQELDPYLKWSDGPTDKGDNPDGLTVGQERLSFTLRADDVLFVCLNTDTFIDDTTIGDVPLHWLEGVLKSAEADESIRHVFVLGHKPLIDPDLPGEYIRLEEVGPMDTLLAGSPKVRAYLTSHFHLWDYRRTTAGVPQVIAGNGGSPPSGNFKKEGVGYYGFTTVDLMESGDLVVKSWGRPIPNPYDTQASQPVATLRETISISHR